ncbi:MAG: sugar phosphate isomerase/epimerase [Planctomycetes bacterium]|nr:sugar phosphate isomerase/epimerase [Planctomycetota bacterium]
MMPWTLAFNTNGFAHHRLTDAIVVLSELGYKGVALTLDVHHLDPYSDHWRDELTAVSELLARVQMSVLIESGARYQLDPRRKHFPSLLCDDPHRGVRLDFLNRCLDVAAALGAPIVSLWSGHDFDGVGRKVGMDRLVEGLETLLPRAEAARIDLAFEPEPGMFIETLDQYQELKDRLPSPRFGLALDVGHLLVTGECEPRDALRRYRGDLVCVAIEDMKRGVHEHLPFGQGDLEVAEVLLGLQEIGYRGFLSVELSRASPDAPRQAEAAVDFLSALGRQLGLIR